MAKRKKKAKTKKKFSFGVELYGILIILMGILGICGYGYGGKLICAFFAFLFGSLYLVPLIFLIIFGIYIIFQKEYPDFFSSKLVGLSLVVIGALIVCHMNYLKDVHEWSDIITKTFKEVINVFSTVEGASREVAFQNIGGGMIGSFLISLTYALFDIEGTKIIYWILIIGGGVLFTGISIVEIIKNGYNKSKELIPHHEEKKIIGVDKTNKIDVKINDNTIDKDKDEEDNKVVINSIDEITNKNKVKEEKEEVIIPKVVGNINYQLPTTELLDKPVKSKTNNQANIENNINILEEVLNEFGVTGKVVAVTVGPACTQYELAIKAGTKLSRLTSINKEISLALAKKDVRIQAPIPGKNTCGIEIANDEPTTVYIKEIMDSFINKDLDKKLLIALGKDIKGEIKTYSINKAPHMLVAGATGSGKSVCINCILASILMRTKPDEVKLILVDPKKVELSMYNGVPHLLCPVVTDPKKAAAALQKVVSEMEHRYDMFEERHVKNIDTYNEWVTRENKNRKDDEKIEKLPFIVVIVDELADLMMVASKEVEDAIMRITQMARAAGIHLIIATQRPSTDVITGVIKANIPTRVAFAVSSGIDSRTILDSVGAEKLLGKGDMLYAPMTAPQPLRGQGAFLKDAEVEAIVNNLKTRYGSMYDDAIIKDIDRVTAGEGQAQGGSSGGGSNGGGGSDMDDLFIEAAQTVIENGSASVSVLQRRLGIGYPRAARLIDELEKHKVIGPYEGSKPRKILMTETEWLEFQARNSSND